MDQLCLTATKARLGQSDDSISLDTWSAVVVIL
jgi:hypothetical protein